MGKWLIASAWPYINAIPHLGNMIGSVLSADVVARYLRMKGEEVVFVSGSDCHGSPIEVEALKKGVSPQKLVREMHKKVSELFKKWNISFDNYTWTESEVHKEFVRNFYLKVYKNGYIFTKKVKLPYCPKCKLFLPDRFVEGKCPYCGYPKARGDQCDSCGRLLEPTMLIDPYCAICGTTPIIKESIHWFFDLPKLAKKLEDYIMTNKNLPDNARNMSLSLLKEGLKPRSLTRDNKWGIPAPFPGAENKTIYVWMEAVLGYISATIEYFKKIGKPEKWKEFWFDKNTKSVFFIAKDNIPFHTIIFPALLLASGEGYNLPWRVDSVEYLMFEGEKFSKSRRIGVWIDEALNYAPADYWRFVLIWIRPELKDSNFRWDIFFSLINNVLNDIIGNFVHRVLTLIYKYFEGVIPKQGRLTEKDIKVLEELRKIHKEASRYLDSFKLKDALATIVNVARIGNKYLNETCPWEIIKKDRSRAATILHVCARLVKALAIMLAPFIPESANKLWKLLGYKDDVHKHAWHEALEDIEEQKIQKPKPLFRKLKREEFKELIERSKPKILQPEITIEDFKKLDIRVGKVIEASKIKGTKLIKLKVDLGSLGERVIVAGIGNKYSPEELKGKLIVVLVNLKPKSIRGVESKGMLLAAEDDEGNISILTVDREIKPGSKVY